MRILKLRIGHFGKLHNCEYEPGRGLNLICGENESGKSTIHAFIRAMLFGLDKPRGRASKEDMYTRYLPWDTPGAYQGSMDFEYDGKEYRITRVFYQKEKAFSMTELSTGKEIKLADGKITSFIPQLTESAYRNTVSLQQLHVRTEAMLAEEVRNHLANLTTAKSAEVDVSAAINILNTEKKKYKQLQVSARCEELEEEYEALLEKEQKFNRLAQESEELAGVISGLEKEKEKTAAQDVLANASVIGQLPVMAEKLRGLHEESERLQREAGQIKESREKCNELADGLERLPLLDAAAVNLDKLYEDSRRKTEEINRTAEERLSALTSGIGESVSEDGCGQAFENGDDDEIAGMKANAETVAVKKKRMASLTLIGLGLGGAVCAVSNNRWSIGLYIGVILIVAGLIAFLFMYLNSKELKKLLGNISELEKSRKSERERQQEERIRRMTRLQQETASINNERQKQLTYLQGVTEGQEKAVLEPLYAASLGEVREEAEELRKKAVLKEQLEEQLVRASAEYEKRTAIYETQKSALSEELYKVAAKLGEAGMGSIVPDGALPTAEVILELHRQLARRHAGVLAEAERLDSEINARKNERERIEWEIDHMGDIGAELDDKKQELKNARGMYDSAAVQLEAIELALKTATALSDEIHDSFGAPFNRLLSKLAAEVTDGRYTEARVNKDLQIEVMDGLDYVSVDKLSTGAVEQMYLALRLAVSELFFENENIPLILDECFAYYDGKRLAAALKALCSQENRQILLFTCHEREKRILDESGAVYTYIGCREA